MWCAFLAMHDFNICWCIYKYNCFPCAIIIKNLCSSPFCPGNYTITNNLCLHVTCISIAMGIYTKHTEDKMSISGITDFRFKWNRQYCAPTLSLFLFLPSFNIFYYFTYVNKMNMSIDMHRILQHTLFPSCIRM